MNEKIDLYEVTTISQEQIVINVPQEVQKEEPKLQIIELQPVQVQEPPKPLITIPIIESKPIKPPKLNCDIQKGPDSIIGSVDTGFGCSNQVVVDCPKPKYKSHLCKENYLGEFKQETEKELARNNLGVYSKEEIDLIVGNIIIENNNFVTKSQVQKMINEADFVNSTLRSYADYQIPDSLFKL